MRRGIPINAAITTDTTTATITEPVVIAVDAMGGDGAPGVVLEGVARALEADPLLTVLLVGTASVVEPFAAAPPAPPAPPADSPRTPHSAHPADSALTPPTARVIAVAAGEVIGMDEHPAQAVRDKKDSSIVVGCRLVKEGQARGFFSAGSTGACMAAATLYIGRVKGVSRPAIASVLPAPASPVVLLDVGANADVKPDYLVQFAQMAVVYAQRIMGIPRPRVGLLNIGEEASKGSMLAQEVFGLMRGKVEGFVGNAEGTDLLTGRFDVIVTDGFTGNVALKAIEGTAAVLFDQLKVVLTATTMRKLAASVIKPGLRQLKRSLSADEVGGAPLLGLKASCVIGHGSSNAKAIANGIAATARCVRARVPETVAAAVG